MNNLFGGQKTQTLDGGISQTNPFKDTIERITNVDERFENMNKARTLHDLQMERSFQQMNLNQEMNMHPMDLINLNVEKQIHPDFFTHEQNHLNKEVNFQNRNVQNINQFQQGNFFNPMSMTQMTPQIHPMLLQFNNQLHQDKTVETVNTKEDTGEKEKGDDILKDIIETMEGQNDERHLNSEFLKFIKQMRTGEIKLNEKENTITKENKEELVYNTKSNMEQDNMEEIWNNLENQMKGINYDEVDYANTYQKESLLLKDNPYLDINKPIEVKDYIEEAKILLEKGDIQNARYSLEAEVTKNEDNAEAWLSLGKIHTENDRDDLAMECFLRALKTDPFNADALLALGISCTNEFDEFEAMVHLRNWIKLHHIYNHYFDNNNILLDYEMIRSEMLHDRDDEDYYSKAVRIEGLKHNFYAEMCNLMETIAIGEKGGDTDLWIALGIANFIPHNNARAIECFRKAVEVNPNDYNAWNKLGAILAHSKMNEEAIATYHKALQLKPNYARCWANLGIAYFNKDSYEDSVKAFLTALKIYKDIGAVWSYLSSVTIAQKRNDLYELVQNRDLDSLLKVFGM